MKHTKGEWIFENIFGRLIVTAGEKGFVIAEVTNKGIAHFIGNEEEAIANAKLIAAAPEMLDALILMDKHNSIPPEEWDSVTYDACQLVKKVIKKATE